MQSFLYGLFAVAGAGILHFTFASTVGLRSFGIYFLYVSAILVASWRGYGPGLFVFLLSVAVIPYAYRPDFSHRHLDPVGVCVLLGVSLGTSYVSARKKRTEALLRDLNRTLEARVREQTDNLERVNSTLRRQILELEMLYRKIPVGICFLDPDLRFVRLNEKLAEFGGLSVAGHIGKTLRQVLPAAVAIPLDTVCRQVLETGESLSNYEITSAASAGPPNLHPRTWSVECSRVLADDGGVLGLQAIVLDVTERYQSQKALARANHELTQFAYLAAHDLQEPLRTLVAYSQLIQQRTGQELGADVHIWLQTVVGAARRMSELVRDLLSYSRATSETEIGMEVVDLELLFIGVQEDLSAAVRETSAEIFRDPLPVVIGNASRLRQVFYNLLSNSLKFHRPGVAPVIRVRVQQSTDEWVFSVQDNGQGFNPEYADRVFGMFKRLHGQDVPGSGVGLAICKAVVEHHGGRIHVIPQDGRGATFVFTLPFHTGREQQAAAVGR
jgi:PAS domain S-box-containing protein